MVKPVQPAAGGTRAGEQPASPRKPYQKPSLEAIQLRVKDDVLAVCRTASSMTSGDTCKSLVCFN